MYAYIEGKLADKSPTTLVIDAGGIGYEISCTQSALANAPQINEFTRVYTYLCVREDAMELMGFESAEEKRMFLRLISVSGIGPRTALGILGAMPLKDLTLALMTGDTAMLARAPGIGKKTAQRLALELKDKLSADDFSVSPLPDQLGGQQGVQQGAVGEAIAALQSLGYTPQEAARAVSAACKSGADETKADEMVRIALRGMVKG